MKTRLLAAVTLAALVGVALPGLTPAADRPSIYETLASRKEHSVLLVAVAEAKEDKALKGEGPYTLFAPTDAAFRALGDAAIKKLARDKDAAKQLLRAHLVAGNHLEVKLKTLNGQELPTLQGTALKVRAEKDGLRVGDAKLVATDVECSNGVIHVIDAVLPLGK